MSDSMVYYCYQGSRPKLQEWKKYYDYPKLCLCFIPQTIFLKFNSTDHSPKHLWIHFLWAWWTGRRRKLSGPCTHRMELHQLLYCCFQHYHHPAWNCDLQLWEFCSRKTQGMNLSNPQALFCWPLITRTLMQKTPCRNCCTLRAAIPQHEVKVLLGKQNSRMKPETHRLHYHIL